MKKILLIAFAFALCSVSYGQSVRTVLMEEFTQASCPPCEATTPLLNNIMNQNADKVVQIRYNTSWPGVDPMNADNPDEIQERVDYYGVTGVPNFNLDGATTQTVPTQGEIDNSQSVDAPILVSVEHTLADDLSSMDVTVRIVNEGATDYSGANDFLRVALVEELVAWPFLPGSTSIIDYEYVFKTFFTTPAGMELPDVAAGDTWEMTWEGLTFPSRIYNYNTLAVVAFVQDDTNAQTSANVINAAVSHPQELTGLFDYSVSAGNPGANDICDSAFSPVAFVRNPGTDPVPSTRVDLYIGDVLVDSEETGEIAGLDVVQIDFSTLDLPGGVNEITYVVEDYNLMNSTSTFNNGGAPLLLAKITRGGTAIGIDFEDEDLLVEPSTLLIESPVIRAFGSFRIVSALVMEALFGEFTDPLGGHGMSENSIIVPFWYWDPANATSGEGSMIAVEEIGLTADNSTFTFDYAYTSWQGSNDALAVQVSNDCGETYTTLWEESGSGLQTAPELSANDRFFSPASDEWASAQVDLSSYIGDDVVVRLLVTSDFGDMLYLDNIQTEAPSSIDELDQDESIALYPNPAVNQITLDMNINQVSDVNIRMVNILGETVLVDRMESVSGNSVTSIDVSNMVAGAYVVYMTVGDKEVVRRISVAN